MLKHNRPRSISLSKGRKLCGKSRNCLCGKGFQCSVFSNLSEFNTLNGIIPATMLKINSLILGNGKHTRRKGQENVFKSERERETEMGKKVSVDD